MGQAQGVSQREFRSAIQVLFPTPPLGHPYKLEKSGPKSLPVSRETATKGSVSTHRGDSLSVKEETKDGLKSHSLKDEVKHLHLEG